MPLPFIPASPVETPLASMAHVIQLAVAPVFLLTGIAALLNVLSGRLSRIVDRARLLESQLPGASAPRAQGMRASLQRLAYRARLASYAISLCTSSAVLVSAVVIALFLGSLFNFNARTVIAVMFIAAMLGLTAGLLCLLREVFLSTQYLRIGEPEPEQKPALSLEQDRKP
jgi:F0F1-type ATP synthase assembly protein I